jgi:hypothetical protein
MPWTPAGVNTSDVLFRRMIYVEEKTFTLRLELRCTFPDDYDGDQDGYAWAGEVAPLAAEIVQAATAALRRRGDWQVRAANRGRPEEEEVLLVGERTMRG